MHSRLVLVLAGLSAACGAEAGATLGDLPADGGIARFLLPEFPGEAAGAGPVPEVPVQLLFDGSGASFGLVGPNPHAGVQAAGRVEREDGAFVLTELGSVSLPIEGPTPGRKVGWDSPRLERVVVRPLDSDGDGEADRLRATFTGIATHFEYDYWNEERPFTSTASAAIEPADPGVPEPFDGTLPPTDAIALRFPLPVELLEARIRTATGEVSTAWEHGSRVARIVPARPLPWGETVVVEGKARVAGSGDEGRPFEVEVPVLAGPTAPWAESFEAADLSGFVVALGGVRLADESAGLSPLDGDRFLLVENRGFRVLFEAEVPDVEVPVLRFSARFAFRSVRDRQAVPWGTVSVVGDGARIEAGFFRYGFDRVEGPLGGPVYGASSPVEAVEIGLAALRGQRVVVAISGETRAGSGGFNDDPLPAEGDLQLDGLRFGP